MLRRQSTFKNPSTTSRSRVTRSLICENPFALINPNLWHISCCDENENVSYAQKLRSPTCVLLRLPRLECTSSTRCQYHNLYRERREEKLRNNFVETKLETHHQKPGQMVSGKNAFSYFFFIFNRFIFDIFASSWFLSSSVFKFFINKVKMKFWCAEILWWTRVGLLPCDVQIVIKFVRQLSLWRLNFDEFHLWARSSLASRKLIVCEATCCCLFIILRVWSCFQSFLEKFYAIARKLRHYLVTSQRFRLHKQMLPWVHSFSEIIILFADT